MVQLSLLGPLKSQDFVPNDSSRYWGLGGYLQCVLGFCVLEQEIRQRPVESSKSRDSSLEKGGLLRGVHDLGRLWTCPSVSGLQSFFQSALKKLQELCEIFVDKHISPLLGTKHQPFPFPE